jgi:hypothetical protein
MQTNQLPAYDMSDSPTGCCPRFNSGIWDDQELHLKDKLFVKAETKSAMHIPLNMGRVFERVQKHLEDAKAYDPNGYVVLSDDSSPWKAQHYFAAAKPVPGEDMITLSGDFVTKVFEGPFRDASKWCDALTEHAREKGHDVKKIYYFYTTCPKCAKAYGKNYVVGIAQV